MPPDLRLVTAVTCPTMRVHPAVVAQAAATTATLMPGRFTLGLGSGENLNEHVVGSRWPAPRLMVCWDEDAALAGMVVTDRLDDLASAVQRFADAGVTHLSIHQVGPRQEGFLAFAAALVESGARADRGGPR